MRPERNPDPAWIRFADRCYGASLWLFSSGYRREYGALMRQAFRDRCREVARGERGALQTFALELAPDLITTLGKENMHATFGNMRPRQAVLLALLSVCSAYYLFGEAMGLRLSDLAFTMTQHANRIHNEREDEALRARLHRIAEPLAAEKSAESKALASLTYRFTETATGFEGADNNAETDIKAAQNLARQALAGQPDAFALTLLAWNCWPMSGCDLAAVARRMIVQSPDNGYTWALEYKLGMLAKDGARMRRALGRLAGSRYYDAQEGRVARSLLTAVEKYAPDDAATMDALAHGIVGSNWSSSVRLGSFCDPADSSIPRFGLTASEIESAREDCVQAGRLMAQATHLETARRGWKIVNERSLDPAELALAQAGARDVEWLRQHVWVATKPGGWFFSNRPHVEMLIASFHKGEGEIASIRQWLKGLGIPAYPPAQN